MAGVNHVHTSQTATAAPTVCKNIKGTSPFKGTGLLSTSAVSPPVLCGLACFLSGLLGSAVLATIWPASTEADDLRSFTSFGLGALMCCFLLKKGSVPCQPSNVATKSRHVSSAVPVRDERQGNAGRGEFPRPSASLPGLTRPTVPAHCDPPPGLERPVNALSRERVTRVPRSPVAQGKPELTSRPFVRMALPEEVVEEAPILPYAPQTFRKEVIAIMKALASHRNVAMAVRQVRLRGVPVERQAAELADILTYALEEVRGTVRRLHVAFVGGLAGAFEKREFIAGVELFFDGVYTDLCDEVPKLPKLVKIEVVPTLRSVLSADEFIACVPEGIDA